MLCSSCAQQGIVRPAAMTSRGADQHEATDRACTPLERFLQAFDRLDADACAALFAADGRLRYVDGRVEEGAQAVRECLRGYFADLRSTEHVVREHWHCHGVWIGEVE